MSKSLFIGRWQPFHEGHKALIDTVLSEDGKVVIAVRDTPLSEGDPYTASERVERIEKVYKNNPNVEIIIIPDIKEVCYGREVGWGVRHIRMNKEVESVSATKIRNSSKRVIWITGNTGSGKTSIAYLLKKRLNGVVLDGDEIRSSISADLGFSKKDREIQNIRVAKLAKLLNDQGLNVIVSVIAPFQSIRDKIEKITKPYWIYLKNEVDDPDKPYEPPKNANIIIDPTEESLLQSLDKILKEIGDLP